MVSPDEELCRVQLSHQSLGPAGATNHRPLREGVWSASERRSQPLAGADHDEGGVTGEPPDVHHTIQLLLQL